MTQQKFTILGVLPDTATLVNYKWDDMLLTENEPAALGWVENEGILGIQWQLGGAIWNRSIGGHMEVRDWKKGRHFADGISK